VAGEGKGGGWNSRGSSKIKVGATVSLPEQARHNASYAAEALATALCTHFVSLTTPSGQVPHKRPDLGAEGRY
jgi:hypothetical protein